MQKPLTYAIVQLSYAATVQAMSLKMDVIIAEMGIKRIQYDSNN